MDEQHLHLQFQRLERHYQKSLKDKDEISFLDLAHTLRIWTEVKHEVDQLVINKSFNLKLANNNKLSRKGRKMLRGSKFTYIPVGSGVESPGIQVKGMMVINRALTHEEIKQLYKEGPPTTKPTNLTFSEWLGSGILDVSNNDDGSSQISLSREIVIKRIANLLGASHPLGNDYSDENENAFDKYVLDLHKYNLADGYPATYYQLLEIAKDIIEGFKPLFSK